jgi:hypothetical protein
MRLTRTDGGTFDNDAKACYDRIIPSMTSVCAQRLGMKPVNVRLHTRTLQQAKYRLKTLLGTSETSYSKTKENPLYGLGQGSTAAAFAWAVISAVILQLMKLLRGIQFSNPTGTINVQRLMDAFVNDSTRWNNRFKESLQNRSRNYIRQIVSDLSHTAQTWEKLLYSTGGALGLSKCFYYLVPWIYDTRGDPTIAPPDPSIPPIKITNSATGETVQIKQLDCSEPHKTLRDAEVRLGPWLPTWQAHRHWNQLYSPTQGYCWVRDKGHWNCYLKPTTPRQRYQILDTSEVVEEEELDAPNAIPIDLWRYQDNAHVAIPQIQEEPTPPSVPATSLEEFVQQAPNWTTQLFDHLQSYETQQQSVLSALATNQKISIYTHGTHESKKGAFVWTIQANDKVLWEGSGNARGEPMSANRAQAYGYRAAITFLSRLIEFYNAYSTPRTTIKVFSDSKGWQVQKKWFFDRIVDRQREYSYPDHDVTLQIEAVAHSLKPQIELKDLLVPSYKPATKKAKQERRSHRSADPPT